MYLGFLNNRVYWTDYLCIKTHAGAVYQLEALRLDMKSFQSNTLNYYVFFLPFSEQAN